MEGIILPLSKVPVVHSYLSVEKAVEQGREEALKGDQERRDEAPGGEVGKVLVVRRGHHLEAVGDPEQGLQHDGRLHRFPAKKNRKTSGSASGHALNGPEALHSTPPL